MLGHRLWRHVGVLCCSDVSLLQIGPLVEGFEPFGVVRIVGLFCVVPLRRLLRREGRMKIVDVRSDFAEKKCTAFSQLGDDSSVSLPEVVRGVPVILIERLGIDLYTALWTDAFRLSIDETSECQLSTRDRREMR